MSLVEPSQVRTASGGVKRSYHHQEEEENSSDRVSDESQNPYKRIKRRKYAILVSYSGLGYYGLQRNPGTRTIEEDILRALFKCNYISEEGLNQPQSFQFQRAARTDKGVSALTQLLSARLCENLEVEEINKHLPDQIRIMGVKRVTKGFNSKMNCDARTYSYTMPSFSLAPHHLFPSLQAPPPPLGDNSTSEAELLSSQDYSDVYRFRATPDLIDQTNKVLQLFVGTHNFHNFTSRRKALDPSCQRYIMSFTCSDAHLYDDIEFVTIRVKGQSFMLHQIRKMIGLSIAIVRGLTPMETVSKAWEKERLDLPIAPGLGLVLEEVHYDRYNKRYGEDGVHEPIDWSHLSEQLTNFKNQFILSNILTTEKSQHSMCCWLKSLNNHSYDVRESGAPNETSGTTAVAEDGYTSD